MITLTKLNGKAFILNAWHIEQLEATPDTMITLANGKKVAVKESLEEVLQRAKRFYRDTTLRSPVIFGKGDERDE